MRDIIYAVSNLNNDYEVTVASIEEVREIINAMLAESVEPPDIGIYVRWREEK